MHILKQINAFILDMDGTLIDSMGIWHEIDQKFFAEHGLTPPAGLSDQVNKMTMQEWAAYFIQHFKISLTESEIIQRIETLAAGYYQNIIQAKPYLMEFLDFLDQKHIPYGIATATYKSSAKAVLARLGILDRMQFILTAEDIPSCKKNPDMFLAACDKLGSDPAHTCILEDSLHCIQTAKQAGFFTIAVHDPHTPAKDWQEMQKISNLSGEDLQEIILKL